MEDVKGGRERGEEEEEERVTGDNSSISRDQ
jgi:hypothetical protein